MTDRTWLDDEATVLDSARQAFTLFLRGVRRPVVTLACALALCGAVAAAMLLPNHGYAPKLTLRVTEADRDPNSMPQPARKLREYVLQALLTSDHLIPLIKQYGLYPGLARKNMRAALDSFREDIDVDVYQNYFVEQRVVGSEPRTARVSVSYKAKDPDTAVAVTRDIGTLIVERERAMRSAESDRAENSATTELYAVRELIANKTRTIATIESSIQSEPSADPVRQVELVGVMGSLAALERREAEVQKREAALSLNAAMEKRGIGLAFEVADEAEAPSNAHRREIAYLSIAAAFLFGAPLVAMAVGSLKLTRGTT
ncbi:MAG TPA: hypothetical protein VH062_25185 [Polyangiaceae bacterium]|jgi:hypothetical protein|nr:hypothetical protein [Polyangiaceae bacterium]